MNKLMATNIQRDLSEAKTVRQSLDAMGRASGWRLFPDSTIRQFPSFDYFPRR